MKNILTIILALFTVSLVAQVDNSKSKKILEEVSKQTKSYTTIKIDFTYSMQAQGISEKMEGNVLLKGDKYVLHLLGRTIVSDGKTVWAYDKESNEVIISNVDPDNELSNPAKILTSYSEDYRSKLISEKTEEGVIVQTIDLYPNEGKSFFKVRLKINKAKKQIISSSIYEKDGTIYKYEVKSFKTNVAVKDSDFVFDKSKYPGVEELDMR
jgi:outer membrane lipoprotein carrier protein